MATRLSSLGMLAAVGAMAGCTAVSGRTTHTLEGRPVLEIRKARDETRLGWHNELWLIVEGASMRIAEARARAEPRSPIPLDPAEVYSFTVERIETFSSVEFSLLSIARGGRMLYSRPDSPAAWISRDEAIRVALSAFREAAPGDPWYRAENLSAVLVTVEGRRRWSVSCSGSPIAGGGGQVLVDATSGAVVDLHIPPGSR